MTSSTMILTADSSFLASPYLELFREYQEAYRTGTRKLIADTGLALNAACSPFSLDTPYGLSGLCQLTQEERTNLVLLSG